MELKIVISDNVKLLVLILLMAENLKQLIVIQSQIKTCTNI